MTDRLASLLALIGEDPSDAELRYLPGQEHASRGDHEQALAAYAECLERDSKYAYAHYHRGRSLEELGREPEEIRAELERGLAAAKSGRDGHAAAEIEEFLDEL